jgi:hypothetical protein
MVKTQIDYSDYNTNLSEYRQSLTPTKLRISQYSYEETVYYRNYQYPISDQGSWADLKTQGLNKQLKTIKSIVNSITKTYGFWGFWSEWKLNTAYCFLEYACLLGCYDQFKISLLHSNLHNKISERWGLNNTLSDELMLNLTASAGAGLVNAIVTTPLHSLKVKLIAPDIHEPTIHNNFQRLSHIHRIHNINWMTPKNIKYEVYKNYDFHFKDIHNYSDVSKEELSYYAQYKHTNQQFNHKTPKVKFWCGPWIKCHGGEERKIHYKGVLNSLYEIRTREGVFGLYDGFFPIATRKIAWSMAFFSMHESTLSILGSKTVLKNTF